MSGAYAGAAPFQGTPNIAALLAGFGGRLPTLTDRQYAIDNAVANVRDFGATGDGVTSDTAAFEAAFAVSNAIYVPRGAYNVAGLSIAGGRRIRGEDRTLTTLTGAGDLLLNAGDSAAQGYIGNLALTNGAQTKGKLVTAHIGAVANARVLFDNVEFGASNYHVYGYDVGGCTCVDWMFLNCRFGGALIVSRYFDYITAYREYGCYTWFNAVGLRVLRGENIKLDGTYEYNDNYAMDFSVGDVNVGLYNVEIGCYFEGNGNVTPNGDVNIATTGATRIRNVTFRGATFSVSKAAHNVVFNQGGGGNIQRLSFYDCTSDTSIIANGLAPNMSNCENITGSAPADAVILERAITNLGGTANGPVLFNGNVGGALSTIGFNQPFGAGGSFDLTTLADGTYLVTGTIQQGGAAATQVFSAMWIFQKFAGMTSTARVLLAADSPGNNDGDISMSGAFVVTISWGGSRTGRIVTTRLS